MIFSNYPLWLTLLLIALVTLACNHAASRLLRFLVRRNTPEQRVWTHAVLGAINAPLRVLIVASGALVMLDVFFAASAHRSIANSIPYAGSVLITLVVTWFLVRLVPRAQHNYKARALHHDQAYDLTLIDALGKLALAVIFVVAALSLMQVMHVPLSGLLAFGGAAGIAVGFAAQTLVANLLGGLTIFASGIFKIGESIIIPGTELMGEVKHIGWRSTQVLGFDRRPFYIPNSVFNTSSVINHTRMTHRRIKEDIHLRYADWHKIPEVVLRGNEMLAERRDLDYFVLRFNSFGAGTLELRLYAHVAETAYKDFMRVKEELLLALADIAHEAGCRLALPLTHVTVERMAAGSPVAGGGGAPVELGEP